MGSLLCERYRFYVCVVDGASIMVEGQDGKLHRVANIIIDELDIMYFKDGNLY
jgi:hypothetical protein